MSDLGLQMQGCLFTKSWRLWAQGIHLTRLIYISREEFGFLKDLKKRFERSTGFRKYEEENRKVEKKSECQQKEIVEEKVVRKYEASKIWATRNSLLWGWRRVNEYYRELRREEELGKSVQEARAFMRS